MLGTAFIETPEYNSLLSGSESFIVVGRRGTGKSALFYKLREQFRPHTKNILIDITPDEIDVQGLQFLAQKFGKDYRNIRSASRFAWQFATSLSLLSALSRHYRVKGDRFPEELLALRDKWDSIAGVSTTGRLYQVWKQAIDIATADASLSLTDLSHTFHTKELRDSVLSALRDSKLHVMLLFDKLDEGWFPDESSSAFVAGLLSLASDYSASDAPIRSIIFVRDNIHRSIARLDQDYTRTIEGKLVRLYWDEHALFRFACARIRVAFQLENVEKDEHVWDRVTGRGLQRKDDGFKKCLQHTLYRPRDLLSQLNRAFGRAFRAERNQIIDDDLTLAAQEISENRLNDLLKEYEVVVPSLPIFVDAFRNRSPETSTRAATSALEHTMPTLGESPKALRDYSLLGPENVMRSLYGIGFIGVLHNESKQYCFLPRWLGTAARFLVS